MGSTSSVKKPHHDQTEQQQIKSCGPSGPLALDCQQFPESQLTLMVRLVSNIKAPVCGTVCQRT